MHFSENPQTPNPPPSARRLVSRIPLLIMWTALLVASAAPLTAASCWEVTGWDGITDEDYVPGYGDKANLVPADCTLVPEGWGWVKIETTFSEAPPPDLYLRMRHDSPRIDGWIISYWRHHGWLVYEGLGGDGTPSIRIDGHLCTDCPPASERLYPYPPVQAPKFWLLGRKVRLRHAGTNHCLYPIGGNNGQTISEPCYDSDVMTFVLDHMGSGQVRLRHEGSDQCLYTLETDNGTVHHWSCSGSPTQRFALPLTPLMGGGFRLQNVGRGQCIYGNPDPMGLIRSWSCWESSNQVFKIDRLE